MAAPLPPVVNGPIVTTSDRVLVSGVLAAASVELRLATPQEATTRRWSTATSGSRSAAESGNEIGAARYEATSGQGVGTTHSETRWSRIAFSAHCRVQY